MITISNVFVAICLLANSFFCYILYKEYKTDKSYNKLNTIEEVNAAYKASRKRVDDAYYYCLAVIFITGAINIASTL